MTKKINIFVKGKMAVGKTTFINNVRDILKRNKKFKTLFEDYEFDVYEFAEDENKEYQSASNKRWTIKEGKFEEKEFIAVAYEKSFFKTIGNFIVKIFKSIFKLFVR